MTAAARALHEDDSRRRERALLHPILPPAGAAIDWNRRVALSDGVAALHHSHPIALEVDRNIG